MITDNGREFENVSVKKWTQEKGVKHVYSIPYYHQSNGRIERANRTIRNAFRKKPGITKVNLKGIIENYNKLKHRGINMSPEEATKQENWEAVRKFSEKYKKEFEKYNKPEKKFTTGDKVMIRKEIKENKMDNEFEMNGTILENEYGDVYKVKTSQGLVLRKHATQLRRILPEGSWIGQ